MTVRQLMHELEDLQYARNLMQNTVDKHIKIPIHAIQVNQALSRDAILRILDNALVQFKGELAVLDRAIQEKRQEVDALLAPNEMKAEYDPDRDQWIIEII